MFLIKLQVSRPITLWKRDFNAGFFLLKAKKNFRTPILKNMWKNERLQTTASCLSDAKYAFQISCYTPWNQLCISTMVLPKPEVFFSSFFKDSFEKINITSCFSLSFIFVFWFFGSYFFLKVLMIMWSRNACKMFSK